MIFEQIAVGHMQNFCYLIGCEQTKEAAIVDPAWEVDRLLGIADKYGVQITKIILTHTHFDHIEGVEAMFEETEAPVYVHAAGENEIAAKGVTVNPVDEGSIIDVGTLKIAVLYTPGHSPTNICLQIDNKLITGDTLFVEGCGGVDFPDSDIAKQWAALERIKAMPEDTEIYPGHDYGSIPYSTVKHEKEKNPFLRCNSFEEFNSIR